MFILNIQNLKLKLITTEIFKMNRKEKHQFLLENGWWCHYHHNCWFESSKDTQYLDENGKMVGFRPEEEGLTLEEAFKQCTINIAKKIDL